MSSSTPESVDHPLQPQDKRQHHPFRHSCEGVALEQGPTANSKALDDQIAELLAGACGRLVDPRAAARPNRYVILSADIRGSTFLMKESEDLAEYARVMTSFIKSAKRIVGRYGGWFDKFMGDGFLAYWPADLYYIDRDTDTRDPENAVALHLVTAAHLNMSRTRRSGTSPFPDAVPMPPAAEDSNACALYGLAAGLATADLLIRAFENEHKRAFRRNSRNFRAGTGLSIGLDVGTVQLVQIGDEISVVGHPVVGAVRMTSQAAASEIIGNASVGELLLQPTTPADSAAASFINSRMTYEPILVTTKEYEQEAWRFAPREVRG